MPYTMARGNITPKSHVSSSWPTKIEIVLSSVDQKTEVPAACPS